MIKPLFDNVLLKKEDAPNTTLSGIIVSQNKEKEDFAIVKAISDCQEIVVNDKCYKMPLKVGDKVMYKKYSATEIKDNEEEYLLIKVEDILAIVED